MTALTDTKKQNKLYQEKNTHLNHYVQSGERGRGDKERVLRVKPKGSQGGESVCPQAAARTPPPKGKHKGGGEIPALSGL